MFEDRRGAFGHSQPARFANHFLQMISIMGSCWPESNDYPDLCHLASQFETLTGTPEMVIVLVSSAMGVEGFPGVRVQLDRLGLRFFQKSTGPR